MKDKISYIGEQHGELMTHSTIKDWCNDLVDFEQGDYRVKTDSPLDIFNNKDKKPKLTNK